MDKISNKIVTIIKNKKENHFFNNLLSYLYKYQIGKMFPLTHFFTTRPSFSFQSKKSFSFEVRGGSLF